MIRSKTRVTRLPGKLAMVTVKAFLPTTDGAGRRVPQDRHEDFLAFVLEAFTGSRFIGVENNYQVLLIVSEGGLIAHSSELRGLANVAKAYYGVAEVQFEYYGHIESV